MCRVVLFSVVLVWLLLGGCSQAREIPQVPCGASSADTECGQQSNTTHIEDGSISEQKCNEYYKAIKAEGPKCNYEDIALSGEPAVSGEFPFLALITLAKDKYSAKVGGTLISEKFVISAAKIDYDWALSIFVRLGITQSNYEGVEFRVLRTIKHPYSINRDFYNNIALLELNDTVKFTKWILPACLWNRNEIEQSTAIATRFNSLRWQDDKIIFDRYNLISNSRCNDYDKYKLNKRDEYRGGIGDRMLCAMASGRPICDWTKDIGHPLFTTREESQCKFYIIGIIKGDRQCNSRSPDVYTRVSYFVKWIEKIVWPEPYLEPVDLEPVVIY